MITAANTLSPSDRIFVTLTQNGREILNMRASNFSSMQEIMKSAAQFPKPSGGITFLSVRNQTQGWRQTMPLLFPSSMPRLSLR